MCFDVYFYVMKIKSIKMLDQTSGGKAMNLRHEIYSRRVWKFFEEIMNYMLEWLILFSIWTVWLFSWICKHQRKPSAFIFSKQHASKNVSAWQMASRKLLISRHFPKRSLKIFWIFLFEKISSDVAEVCERILNVFKKEIFTKEIRQFDDLNFHETAFPLTSKNSLTSSLLNKNSWAFDSSRQ